MSEPFFPGPMREVVVLSGRETAIWCDMLVNEVNPYMSHEISVYLQVGREPLNWDHQDPSYFRKVWK